MKFGIATCDITPPFPTSMGGYAARESHFQGVHDPLQFGALVLEEGGRRTLIASADLVTWPNGDWTPRLIDRLASRLGTEPGQVLLNASHTHGGPKVPDGGFTSLLRGDVAASYRYLDWLADRVVACVESAARDLRPGTLHLASGKTTLPMNRRLLLDGEIINAPNPDGPVDDGMQLLVVKDQAQRLAAIAMRISCHPVATGAQHLITADFVGAWRDALRRQMPGVQPIFLQGAAGDMRPRCVADGATWRMMPHAELAAAGEALAAETLQTLHAGKLEPVDDLILHGHVETCFAPCEPWYTSRAAVEPLLRHPRRFERDFAEACLAIFRRNQQLPTSVEFRVQTLWLNDRVALVGLNCEPLHRLGLAIERAFAPPHQALVLGYTGGCVGYAPDTDALRLGGYEAETYLFEPWSGPWRHGFETTFRPHLLTRPGAHALTPRVDTPKTRVAM